MRKSLDLFFDDPSTASIFFNCAVSAINERIRPHYILVQQRFLLFGLNMQIDSQQYESLIMYFSDYCKIDLNNIFTFNKPTKMTYHQLQHLMKGVMPSGLINNKNNKAISSAVV